MMAFLFFSMRETEKKYLKICWYWQENKGQNYQSQCLKWKQNIVSCKIEYEVFFKLVFLSWKCRLLNHLRHFCTSHFSLASCFKLHEYEDVWFIPIGAGAVPFSLMVAFLWNSLSADVGRNSFFFMINVKKTTLF